MPTAIKDISDNTPINTTAHTESAPDPHNGYRKYAIGGFIFERDEYFARIKSPTGTHVVDIENFLRSMMRDVAWGFFYGWVNFDEVIGTVNLYGSVDLYMGTYNSAYRESGTDYVERFDSQNLLACFKSMLKD